MMVMLCSVWLLVYVEIYVRFGYIYMFGYSCYMYMLEMELF